MNPLSHGINWKTSFGFLWEELEAEIDSAHKVYRGIRAIVRLNEESIIPLSDVQLGLVKKLEMGLRKYYEKDSQSPEVDCLFLTQAKAFLKSNQFDRKKLTQVDEEEVDE